MATTGIGAHHVYSVQPDDMLCVQPSCHQLKYLVENSHLYFISNTTFYFAEGEYHHVHGDLIVQNVSNFSLIGTPNTSDPASPASVIKCLPEHSIYFYNVANLLVKDLKFQSCGGLLSNHNNNTQEIQWAALLFQFCTNLKIVNVYIYNPVGYGISAHSVIGNNSLENVTVIMGRNNAALDMCSYGAKWSYRNLNGDFMEINKIIVTIDNIMMKQLNISLACVEVNSDKHILDLELYKHKVQFTIKNSNFSILNGTILNVKVLSALHSHININQCSFIQNSAHQLISFQYILSYIGVTKDHSRLDVTFHETVFSHNKYSDYLEDIANASVLKFQVSSKNHQLNLTYDHTLSITFNDTIFYGNQLALLQVVAPDPLTPNHSSVHMVVSTEGYYIAEANRQQTRLISLTNGHLYFNGITKFINNTANEVVYLSSSMLHFSNTTVFDNNTCKQLISLNCKLCYLMLTGRANITFSNNAAFDQLIHVPIRNNQPYPYCIFQYYSPIHNGYNDFQISMLHNDVDVELISDTVFQLTSHCKWAFGAAFQNMNPSVVNSEIIDFGYKNATSYQLGTHTTVCYCPSSSHYNCSVDQLGPVYPGENLTVDLCLPYNNEEIGILYIDTCNDNLPQSACIMNDHKSAKHVFHYKERNSLDFAIASAQPAVCELFLTAQPNLFIFYEAFYVHLLPCPLGFTLQHGICDCDPDLRKYIDECMISSQTVRRLSNTYILGINSTKQYKVSTDCPTYYCLQGTTWINLHHPDDQCQPHRTGLLCSQCTEGYSVVFGSSRCKKCSNVHLLYLLYFMFTGLLLIFLLFLFNLTVTNGPINSFIFYVNIVRLSSSAMHLPDRLVSPLLAYIYIANIETYVERCLYDGMDMYAKKFIALTYPLYFLLIATTLILGSRYSTKLHRLTFNRALPVLATLFVLTYTTMLYVIASTPLYTTIITIPSHSSKNLWLLDPTIPLFGWKFSLLISVCLLLFLFLLMFNVILLFTKPLMRFKIIHRFKPLIDAFQGSFKSHYYYWIGIQLLIRNIIALLSVLEEAISLTISCIIIVTVAIIHGYIQPNKSKIVNFQESLLLYNFITLCIFLIFNRSETLNVIMINVVVGLSFLHCALILVYHVFTFLITIRCTNVTKPITNVWNYVENKIFYRRQRQISDESYNIHPEVGINLVDFREPLIGED